MIVTECNADIMHTWLYQRCKVMIDFCMDDTAYEDAAHDYLLAKASRVCVTAAAESYHH